MMQVILPGEPTGCRSQYAAEGGAADAWGRPLTDQAPYPLPSQW